MPANKSQQGTILVFFALMLPILVVCGGMSLDFGRAYFHKSYLQNVADAAALAGAAGAQGSGRARLVSVDAEVAHNLTPADAELLAVADGTASPVIEANTGAREDLQDKNQGLATELWKERDGTKYYYRVELREAVKFAFAGVLIPTDFLPHWTVAAAAVAQGTVGDKTLYEQLKDIEAKETYDSFQALQTEMQSLNFGDGFSKAQYRREGTMGTYYRYDPATGSIERVEYGYPGVELDSVKSLAELDDEGNRLDNKTKKDKYINVRDLFIDFKPDISTGRDIGNWDLADGFPTYASLANLIIEGMPADWLLKTKSQNDVVKAFMDNFNLTEAEAKELLNRFLKTRINYQLNFNRLYAVRGNLAELAAMDAKAQAEREKRLADGSKGDENYFWQLATRDSQGNIVESDPLLVHIESEELSAGNSTNSVRKININIQADNTVKDLMGHYKYRPLVFFYEGPSLKEGVAVGSRVSQPVTLNLEKDFRGILFAPNSPVCIKGNGHKLQGFVVAKEFIDEEGNTLTFPGDYDKLNLSDREFDTFGLVNISTMDPKEVLLTYEAQKLT